MKNRKKLAKKKAKGSLVPSGKRKIGIEFDQELFDCIAQEAVEAGIHFSQQVRIYIGKGMLWPRPSMCPKCDCPTWGITWCANQPCPAGYESYGKKGLGR